ncbi:hypothetical protein [Geothrix paludis]|uniref:hypothetical protein n=1 Tax=Geothrix paludis TaxID=2922722 RepID=UPI001FAB994D|nr:hypothetical protein [Geothrix paludis]
MSTSKRAFKIHGMDCAEEIALLKREVGPAVGGEGRLSLDLLNGIMIVEEGASASSEAIIQAIPRTGMKAESWTDGRPPEGKSRRQWVQLALMVASGALTALAFGLHAW